MPVNSWKKSKDELTKNRVPPTGSSLLERHPLWLSCKPQDMLLIPLHSLELPPHQCFCWPPCLALNLLPPALSPSLQGKSASSTSLSHSCCSPAAHSSGESSRDIPSPPMGHHGPLPAWQREASCSFYMHISPGLALVCHLCLLVLKDGALAFQSREWKNVSRIDFLGNWDILLMWNRALVMPMSLGSKRVDECGRDEEEGVYGQLRGWLA